MQCRRYLIPCTPVEFVIACGPWTCRSTAARIPWPCTSAATTPTAANPGERQHNIDHRIYLCSVGRHRNGNEYEFARMGERLYASEEDYTGNGALVPGDPNTVYISTQYDPRDPPPAPATEHDLPSKFTRV